MKILQDEHRTAGNFKKLFSLMLCCSALPLSSAYAMHFQGPLVVDSTYIKKHGNTITGNYQGTQTQPAILVSNASTPVFIVNSNVQGPGDLIDVVGSNVTVMNTTGIGLYPTVTGTAKGKFLSVTNPVNLVVSNCIISDVSYGVYVTGYSGNNSVNNAIKITNNHMSNIDARPTNGSGGYVSTGDFNNAHAVQLNNVLNVPGIEIAWNEIINSPGISASGELIELIDASGISTNHILVHDNYVQGAYPADPGVDTYTGGGIIANGTATDTAATTSAFIDIYNNQVVATANVGIAIAAGHDISVCNNRVVSSGLLANGTLYATTFANGMYNWNYYSQPGTVFFNNNIMTNTIGLINKDANGNPQRSDWYLPGQATTEGNLNYQPYDNTDPTLADEAAEYTAWQQKVANEGSAPTPVPGTTICVIPNS